MAANSSAPSSTEPLAGGQLSQEFGRLKQLCAGEKISLEALLAGLSVRSHALLTLFLSVPFLLPMPLPGLSIPFGFLIIFAGVSMMIGAKPWLPKALLKKSVSTKTLHKIFDSGIRISRALEKLIRPRGIVLASHPLVKQLTGALIVCCGLLLALPLPPGTNFPPAAAIVLVSMGTLEEDILCLSAGYLVVLFNLALFSSLLFFGINGLKHLFS